jgi:hypothetical protein
MSGAAHRRVITLDALSGQNLHKRVNFSNWPLEASRPPEAGKADAVV